MPFSYSQFSKPYKLVNTLQVVEQRQAYRQQGSREEVFVANVKERNRSKPKVFVANVFDSIKIL